EDACRGRRILLIEQQFEVRLTSEGKGGSRLHLDGGEMRALRLALAPLALLERAQRRGFRRLRRLDRAQRLERRADAPLERVQLLARTVAPVGGLVQLALQPLDARAQLLELRLALARRERRGQRDCAGDRGAEESCEYANRRCVSHAPWR